MTATESIALALDDEIRSAWAALRRSRNRVKKNTVLVDLDRQDVAAYKLVLQCLFNVRRARR